MIFATYEEIKLILVTAKLLKRSPAGYLSRTYFILRTLYAMDKIYYIDITTLTRVLNENEHVAVIMNLINREFERIWSEDESNEGLNANQLSLELLQRIYLIPHNGCIERLDKLLQQKG